MVLYTELWLTTLLTYIRSSAVVQASALIPITCPQPPALPALAPCQAPASQYRH